MTTKEIKNMLLEAIEGADGFSEFPFVRSDGRVPEAAGFEFSRDGEAEVFREYIPGTATTDAVWRGQSWRVYIIPLITRECLRRMVDDDEFISLLTQAVNEFMENGHESYETMRALDRVIDEWTDASGCIGSDVSAAEYIWGVNTPSPELLDMWLKPGQDLEDAVDYVVEDAVSNGYIVDREDVRKTLQQALELLELERGNDD